MANESDVDIEIISVGILRNYVQQCLYCQERSYSSLYIYTVAFGNVGEYRTIRKKKHVGNNEIFYTLDRMHTRFSNDDGFSP